MIQVVKGRLGDRLIEKGRLTSEQLEVALNEQRRFHRPLGEILVSIGFVTQEDITVLVAEDLGLEFLHADEVEPDPLIVSGLDPGFVRKAMAFPFALVNGTLRVVMTDPDDPSRISLVRRRFPYPIDIAITTEAELLKMIRAHLAVSASRVAEILGELPEGEAEATNDFPVEEVARALLLDGIHRQATDIHVEPEELVTRVRYRCDGIMQSGENLPKWVTPAIVSRLKILSGLDISERRRPQDGRLRLTVEERDYDMRVSVMPTQYGENIVLRILSSAGGVLRLGQLGISEGHQGMLRTISERPHGLFLVTGPTGSGKTTTLYAMLSCVDAMHRKVATVEDPIEYRLPLLRQSQVDPAVGFDFGSGLRTLLRQDPDVILVGEIRDEETADMAVKASMTGHLVFSTLHTNSAIGAIPRLVDMGVESYLVQDCLIGSMSQRLVRTVCGGCKAPYEASAEDLAWLGVESAALVHGTGCERCDGSGYQGRRAIQELYMPDEDGAEALRAGGSVEELLEIAIRNGFEPMMEDGKRLVLEGHTTREEIARVGSSHRITAEERGE